MRGLVLPLFIVLALSAAIPAAFRSSNPEELVGTWRVDLRPTPEAEPYYQDFIVSAVEEHTFSGSFYGTDIEDARINTDWGTIYFAFVTRDGSGVYHTSGQLQDGTLAGTTHALGRGFLSVWSATKAN